jgi:DNA-binding NarL/FixJ family response regulator
MSEIGLESEGALAVLARENRMSVNLSHATRAIAHSNWFEAPLDLSSVWPELISGRTRIVNSGVTQGHHYFQLAAGGAARGRHKLTANRVEMFERVLLGEPQKVVAFEVGCSTSTVATAVGDCLRAMGLNGGTSRVPALLVLVLHALRGRPHGVEVRVERSPGAGGELQVVSSARLEAHLRDKLTTTELEVVDLLVQGRTHAEIAAFRRKSARTIANQIASAYRKLGVSGRMELLCYLVSRLGTAGAREAAN